ncbi:isochorismatase [Enterococcus florum]|uniref:Isochorismatase n=1 Tax=Enterococcus florum TaxID=2480627 RepID=A0A4P5P4S5_9ENTE|nr:isochorismatase family cysteine hydrolase [Enterococcus florum]GCF92660.1 isochorismatase [Enterococcus florum]
MTKKALIVIDIQKGTLAPLMGKTVFLANVNALIDAFHQRGLPVIFIKQAGYGEVSPRVNKREMDPIVLKHKPNAFTSADFTKLVAEQRIEAFVVVGLMSNACVQHTCKGALAENFPTTLIEDAHDSVLKPMRGIWNTKLAKLGVNVVSTKSFLQEN